MSIQRTLVGERVQPSGNQLRKKIKSSRTIQGFKMKPDYLYTVVRAISARVNQNFDGWPSDELKKAHHTFIGKPVFVNHENFDPTKARGVVVASRYIENGADKYVEVVQEIDAKRFPMLAHEIKTGGLDSVSMGAEAGFTICSACGNQAYDEPDMCDHVKYHKGEKVTVVNRRTGKREERLVYESCHQLGFFELSYVFDPADETAVASKVIMASNEESQEMQRVAGQCGPGDTDCQAQTVDPRGLPSTAFGGGGTGGAGAVDTSAVGGGGSTGIPSTGGGGSPQAGDAKTMPQTKPLYDELTKLYPGNSIGTYRVDDFHEHDHGAMDFMTSDPAQASDVRQKAFDSGAPYVLWQQTQWNSDGSSSPMEDRGDPTQNHMDHVHIAPIPAGGGSAEVKTAVRRAVMAKLARQIYADEVSEANPTNKGVIGKGVNEWANEDAPPIVSPTTGPLPIMSHKLADATDDYLEWAKKVDSGEVEPERETGPAIGGGPSRSQQQWLKKQRSRTGADDYNTQKTQRSNTYPTYVKAHDYFDKMGAPTDGVLDYGAGLGHSAQWGHTYEPHPREGFEPTYVKPEDVPEGAHGRVTNLNVLNVVPPEIRHQIVQGVGRALAPGGHAVITTRGTREVLDTKGGVPADNGDPNAIRVGDGYQKGFSRPELHQYVQETLGPDFQVKPVGIGPAGVHIVRKAGVTANLRSLVRTAALKKLGWGEVEAPPPVETLREEGSAPEDDNDDFHHYVDSPQELSMPDLDEADQIDREQEQPGQDPFGGQGGPSPDQDPALAGGAPPQEEGVEQGPDGEQFMILKIPLPGANEPTPPPPAGQTGVPTQTFASRTAALQALAYFERYYGHKIADWRDAIEAGRRFTPEENADYIREATLLTLENPSSDSTTSRNTVKGTATMARSSTLATRRKTAGTQHFAEGPFTDGGPYGEEDQGVQDSSTFITETPPADSTPLPDDDKSNISNTEDNLVADEEYAHSLTARMARQKRELEATAREYARVAGIQKRADEYAGGPTAEEVNPDAPTSSANELLGDDFTSADPDPASDTSPGGEEGTSLPTHESSLAAFAAFDKWLRKTTKRSAREHSEANIKKAAKQFADYNGIQVQGMFPALGIALRQARKVEAAKKAAAAKKGSTMRKRAVDLETAAPDERVSVPAPVDNVTDDEAQQSQFDEKGYANNAGDDLAKPDLSTGQNFAPGQAPNKEAKKADGILAIRCAEAMIAAGLEPNTRERKYALAREFEKMSRGLILDRVALAERFAMVRHADRQAFSKVANGSARGAKSPIPAGLGQGGMTRQASQQKVSANDTSNDSLLFG